MALSLIGTNAITGDVNLDFRVSGCGPAEPQLPVTVHDNVVTFSITDGGLGDDDMTVNGSIVDPGGLGLGGQPIPTLSQWMLMLLGLLVALFGLRAIAQSA